MEKRNFLLAFVLGLFLINFVSAQFGYYGGFSLRDLLASVDAPTMVLGSVFLISFVLIKMAVSKIFKNADGSPNTSTAGIVAFILSLLIVWGVNRSGWDFETFFFNIGFSGGLLASIIPLLLIAVGAYVIWTFGLATFLLIFGALLMIFSFEDFIYEKVITFFLGLVFFVLGLWTLKHKKKKPE